MRALGILFSTALAVILAGAGAAQEKKATNKKDEIEGRADFYPLGLGNKWHYQMETASGRSVNLVSQIAKIEKINEMSLARLEGRLDGKVLIEHLSSSDKGVFRHRLNGLEIDPPLCLLKYPIVEGQSWESKLKIGELQLLQKCSVGKWEQVEVPAGKFKAIRVVFTLVNDDGDHVGEYWFAADVGIVMQIAHGNGLKATSKLEKFVEGNREPKDSK